jgi:hypothetical protein
VLSGSSLTPPPPQLYHSLPQTSQTTLQSNWERVMEELIRIVEELIQSCIRVQAKFDRRQVKLEKKD